MYNFSSNTVMNPFWKTSVHIACNNQKFKNTHNNKLSPYVTDGRLFETELLPSLKSRDTKTRTIWKIRPNQI